MYTAYGCIYTYVCVFFFNLSLPVYILINQIIIFQEISECSQFTELKESVCGGLFLKKIT